MKLLSGECFEPLTGILEILAAVEFLDQPIVVRGCFCLIGLEERFRQIVVNGIPPGVSGVVFEDLLEPGDGAGVPARAEVIRVPPFSSAWLRRLRASRHFPRTSGVSMLFG